MILEALSGITDMIEKIGLERKEVKMITKTCDRCGTRINTDPMVNAILPMFSIRTIKDFISGWQSVDLCLDCEKKLKKWLSNEDEEREE